MHPDCPTIVRLNGVLVHRNLPHLIAPHYTSDVNATLHFTGASAVSYLLLQQLTCPQCRQESTGAWKSFPYNVEATLFGSVRMTFGTYHVTEKWICSVNPAKTNVPHVK